MDQTMATDGRERLAAGLRAAVTQDIRARALEGTPGSRTLGIPYWRVEPGVRVCPACEERIPAKTATLPKAAHRHWEAHLEVGRRVQAIVAFIKDMIRADAAAGTFALRFIRSFEDLQERVDANEYLVAAGERFDFTPVKELDLCNFVTGIVSSWLTAGAEDDGEASG